MHSGSGSRLAHNLHNHTTSSDGVYPPEQIVAAAVNSGLAVVGICDHLHSAKLSPGRGVRTDEIDAYLDHGRRIAQAYADQVTVLMGLELCLSHEFADLSAIPWTQRPFDRLDYVLVEDLWPIHPQGLKLQELCRLRQHIGVPVGLAHCDLAPYCSAMPQETLVGLLARHDIFVELCPSSRNAHWMPAELLPPDPGVPTGDMVPIPYYRAAAPLYRQLAGGGVRVAIGTDTHDDLRDVVDIADAVAFIHEAGLDGQLLVDRL